MKKTYMFLVTFRAGPLQTTQPYQCEFQTLHAQIKELIDTRQENNSIFDFICAISVRFSCVEEMLWRISKHEKVLLVKPVKF